MSSRAVIENLERLLRAVEFELELVELSDSEYRQWLDDRGFVFVEGDRPGRYELQEWRRRLPRLLEACKTRDVAGDHEFFDVVFWYGVGRSQEDLTRHWRRSKVYKKQSSREGGSESGRVRQGQREDRIRDAAIAYRQLQLKNPMKRPTKEEVFRAAEVEPFRITHKALERAVAGLPDYVD